MTTRYRAPIPPRHFIREWIKALGLTNQELADAMDTDKSNVTRWISEPRRVNLDVLAGISEALKGRFPQLAEPGNLLKSPEKVMALERFEQAAAIIADKGPERPKPTKSR